MKKRYHIFTDIDLDGIVSYMTCCWSLGEWCSYTACRVNDLDTKINQWLDKNNLADYEAIYILDLDVSSHDALRLIDLSNVHIYDHHSTHVENLDKYEHANVNVCEFTSTCRLFYANNKQSLSNITPQQGLLILMADDYDSYKFKIPNSYQINVLLWSLTGDRFDKFIEMFKDGFSGFNTQQNNIIKMYTNKLDRVKSGLDIYNTTIPINGSNYNICSTFACECINDVADHVLSSTNCDVALVVNTKSNKVSFRRGKECLLDLGKFSKSICDEAGGHAYAAGGMICEKFLNFAKIFKPIS